MTKYLYRAENLLLLVPFALSVIDYFLYDNHPVDIHLHDTYFVIKSFFILVLGFMVTPFLLHSFLRSYGKWNPVFCKTHIFSSIGLQILIFVLTVDYSSFSKSPKEFYDITLRDTYQDSGAVVAIAVLFFFLLLQILFLIYFFIRVFQKPNRNTQLNGASPLPPNQRTFAGNKK
jgi:heme/copper-type cytochrome/quinol oxidase subunit 1